MSKFRVKQMLVTFFKDLLKLRKKITTTVQTLTHVKEKLQFIQAENEILKEQLMEVDTLAAKVSISLIQQLITGMCLKHL